MYSSVRARVHERGEQHHQQADYVSRMIVRHAREEFAIDMQTATGRKAQRREQTQTDTCETELNIPLCIMHC